LPSILPLDGSVEESGRNAMRYPQIALALACLALLAPAAAAQKPGDCGYYVNRDGQTVPRPCGDVRHEQPPRGATTVCRDWEFSYSRHLRRSPSRFECATLLHNGRKIHAPLAACDAADCNVVDDRIVSGASRLRIRATPGMSAGQSTGFARLSELLAGRTATPEPSADQANRSWRRSMGLVM
jgi:hypothetical protein